MEIRQYWEILKKGWWMVVAMMLIVTGIGAYYSYLQIPIYESTAKVVVNPTGNVSGTGDMLYSLDTLASRTTLATTFANLLNTRTSIEAAAVSLGVNPLHLEDYTISVVVMPDSNVIQVQVQGPSPELSADLANAIGKIGEQSVRNLQNIYELRLIDKAIAEYDPISPNHPLDITLSLMVGLAGGLAFIILREILTQAFADSNPTTPLNAIYIPTSPFDPIPSHSQKQSSAIEDNEST